ncbi:MAG: SURF1 family protein [Oceanicaulis sp.]
MTFRPYPLLTLLTVAGLAGLVWLGSWQLDRRAWKAELLAEYQATEDAPLAGLDALCTGEAAPGRRVDLTGAAIGAPYVKVYGRNADGAPGWRWFAAVSLPDCAQGEAILAEVRFEPLETAGTAGLARAEAETVERWRFERPVRPGPFTPARGEDGFYAFDPEGMAEALGVQGEGLSGAFWLAREGGGPPAHIAQTPPERHAAYALTWFLMAIALIGVWLAFHIKTGRIGLRRE